MVEAAESARVNRDELLGRLGRAFGRREPRLQAGTYVDGLMSDTPRKNGWSLAERAGDRTPDKMQRLLNHAVWDEHEAMGIVRDFVVEHLQTTKVEPWQLKWALVELLIVTDVPSLVFRRGCRTVHLSNPAGERIGLL